MARQEVEREDLLSDATAYARRCQFTVADCDDRVFVGLRDDDSVSIYFNDDPVYHFDGESRLRRAFVAGDLYRSQGDHLMRLVRVRSNDRSELHQQVMTPNELNAFTAQMNERCRQLRDDISSESITNFECVGDWAEPLLVVRERLSNLRMSGLALSPALVKRRRKSADA